MGGKARGKAAGGQGCGGGGGGWWWAEFPCGCRWETKAKEEHVVALVWSLESGSAHCLFQHTCSQGPAD